MYSLPFVLDTRIRPTLLIKNNSGKPLLLFMTICIRLYLILFITSILISGCITTAKPKKLPTYQNELNKAKALVSDGRYQDAAQIYTALARKTIPPKRDIHLLHAADALEKYGDTDAARKIADGIKASHLNAQDNARLRLFYGRIYLAENRPEQTLHQLESIPVKILNPDLQHNYYAQQAKVFSLIGNHLESARAYIEVGKHLHKPEKIEKNNTSILTELGHLSPKTLTRLQPTSPKTLNGWMALALIFNQQANGSAAFDQQIDHWRKNHPNHPATTFLSKPSTSQSILTGQEAITIGVLLPRSGPYAKVAEAIKQGIIIAQSHDKNTDRIIRFYDSESDEPYKLFQRAIEDGSNVIIGPLNKHKLIALIEGGELTIPVLGLNQVSNFEVNNLYQFGLNPEDEADQAADSAWSDGYHNALILTPASEFGNRMASHFSDHWQQIGGNVFATQSYDINTTDYAVSINRLLRINAHDQQIHAEYGSSSNQTESSFIFLVALPQQARQIWPQIPFYRTTNIPVYATSQVYGGQENPYLDHDLSGIVFCDAPWLFGLKPGHNPSLETVMSDSQGPIKHYVRFVALGFDAYNLLSHLHRLQSIPNEAYDGVTGRLTLTQSNKIHRTLQCAKFEEGRPVLRGNFPSPHDEFMDLSWPESSGPELVSD